MPAKSRSGTSSVVSAYAFWDTSAIVPLCCHQPQSAEARRAARMYGWQIVWWATPLEAVSSLERLSREGALSTRERAQAFAKLTYLRERWNEIQPVEEVRDLAERLLRSHRLRAADALQLAAALVWCSSQPRGRPFIGADDRLADAAEIEGFRVLRLP
ncbi:MAG: PIN domain-containing protein [Blastocatellia bacterium]|nr:PIN domain-containing protein [Blastocatellia bacterium]